MLSTVTPKQQGIFTVARLGQCTIILSNFLDDPLLIVAMCVRRLRLIWQFPKQFKMHPASFRRWQISNSGDRDHIGVCTKSHKLCTTTTTLWQHSNTVTGARHFLSEIYHCTNILSLSLPLSSPSGSGTQPQPIANLVHFSLKILHLVT